jgi:hypothetical protein
MTSKRLTVILLALVVAVLFVVLLPRWTEETTVESPEARIVAYLDENVTPRRLVLVTDLYNNVFTTPEEREALQRLYDSLFEIPAFVAQTYSETGRIPSLQEVTDHFNFEVPGTTEVLLRVLESDPRVPRFLERDPATGEITEIDVAAIRAHDRFGQPLRD